jgi:hypothetical protein
LCKGLWVYTGAEVDKVDSKFHVELRFFTLLACIRMSMATVGTLSVPSCVVNVNGGRCLGYTI